MPSSDSETSDSDSNRGDEPIPLAQASDDGEPALSPLKALRKTQIKFAQSEAYIKVLRQENKRLKRAQSKAASREALKPKSDEEANIKLAGKKVTVMYQMWLPKDGKDILRLREEGADDWDHPEMGPRQRMLGEILECLPDDLRSRKVRKTDRFWGLFNSATSEVRSSLVGRLRTMAEVFVPEIRDVDVLDEETSRNHLRHLIGYIPEKKYYEAFCPILYEDPDQVTNQGTLFCNIILMKALQASLFGPASIKHDGNPNVNGKCLANLWGVTHVTPGSIAFVAIAVRFIMSSDQTLHQIGTSTGIDYYSDFNSYKRFLTMALNKPSGRARMKKWNDFVFGSIPSGPTLDERPPDDSLASVLEQLADEASDATPPGSPSRSPKNHPPPASPLVVDSEQNRFSKGPPTDALNTASAVIPPTPTLPASPNEAHNSTTRPNKRKGVADASDQEEDPLDVPSLVGPSAKNARLLSRQEVPPTENTSIGSKAPSNKQTGKHHNTDRVSGPPLRRSRRRH